MSKKALISKPILFLIIFLYFVNLTKNNLLEEYNLPEEDITVGCSRFSGILKNKNANQKILEKNKDFISYLKKDEFDSFKIHIPRGNYEQKYEKFQINLNISNNDALIDFSNINNNNIFNIINKTKNKNICYEFIPYKEYTSSSNNIDSLIIIKAKKDLYYSIKYNSDNSPSLHEYEFDEDVNLRGINDFPLKISIKLPFKDEANSNDLLFNFYFNSKDTNFQNTKIFDNFYINITIINNTLKEQIQNNINSDFKYNSKATLSSSIDISTKSAAVKISKDFIKKALNTLDIKNNNEDLYLYITVNKTSSENLDIKNLEYSLFLIYDDYKNYAINTNKYISSKIYYDEDHEEKNYDLYHLQLNNNSENDTFVVDFSSNFALSRGIYVSFLDYDTQKKIRDKDGEIYDNSSKIEFIKSDTKKGKTFHFEFKFKDKHKAKKDIILCIFVKSDELDVYNYVFKYQTKSSGDNNNIIKYKLNDDVNHSNKDDNTILEIENVQVIKDNKAEYYKGEIYVRKILKKHKIDREDLDTIATFKSKYELVQGNIEYTNENKNIKITIPQIYKRDHYSILIDIPEINEKFVYNTVNKEKIKKPYWAIISIFIFVPIYLVVVVCIIIYLANKSLDLQDEILATSFKISGADEDLKADKEKYKNELE